MTWAEKIKKLDEKKCQFCGSTDKLEAHHIKHKSLYPDLANDLENGITLCHRCHYTAHAGQYGERKVAVYRKITAPPEVMKAFIDEYECSKIVYEDTIEHLMLISSHADANGESMNAFISRAIDTQMEIDKSEN